jgi:hypothetical protein
LTVDFIPKMNANSGFEVCLARFSHQ